MADGNITVDRSYVDNYSVKEFAMYELVPKYFDEEEVSDRTIGMVGYTTEILSQLSEDVFNTGSVLFRESFPNRAQIAESIYSHAAIFQLDDIFSTASTCTFLLVVEEAAIIKNMINDYDNNISPRIQLVFQADIDSHKQIISNMNTLTATFTVYKSDLLFE